MKREPIKTVRQRFERDGAALRRYRKRYMVKARKWVEADRTRLDALAERLVARGVYAPTCSIKDVKWAILRHWSKIDGYTDRRAGRGCFEWMTEKGWGWGWFKKAKVA